jgi:hypothetical protein
MRDNAAEKIAGVAAVQNLAGIACAVGLNANPNRIENESRNDRITSQKVTKG